MTEQKQISSIRIGCIPSDSNKAKLTTNLFRSLCSSSAFLLGLKLSKSECFKGDGWACTFEPGELSSTLSQDELMGMIQRCIYDGIEVLWPEAKGERLNCTFEVSQWYFPRKVYA
jgi:hypothetical protein